MKPDSEIFLEFIEDTFGPANDIHQTESHDGLPPVSIFIYRDLPESGMITGITYGLSLADFPAWKYGRPEIVFSIKSDSIEWPCAAATMVASFRGKKAFSYGDIFTTDVPLTTGTEMQGFLVFAQSILDNDRAAVQLSKYKVNFSQFYPIYIDEVKAYEKLGLEKFWKHRNFEMYEPNRNRNKVGLFG